MTTSIEGTKQATAHSHTSETAEAELSSSPSIYARLAEIWTRVIAPFLAIRLLLCVVGMVTAYYVLPLINRHQPILPNARLSRFPDMLVLMWDHFDSGFYLGIANGGYWGADTLHRMSNWAFFPLYPLLIRLVALPFGSSPDSFRLAGIVVSNVAALIAAIYLYKLTVKELNQTIAARAVFYLALFPMSFYLSAIYPESLFLALSISSVYYARLHRWWLAGLLGGLAALTRPQGVLLAIVVGWEYWQVLADRFAHLEQGSGTVATIQNWLRSRFLGLWRSLASWPTWPGFVWLALIPTGLLLFCLYAKWKVGSFLAFAEVEKYGWGRHFTNPIKVVLLMLQHPLGPNPYDWNFYALNILSIFAFWLLLIPVFRKLPAIFGIFTFVFLIMPLTSGEGNSIARYYLAAFPIFMILAWWSSQGDVEQQLRRHSLIVASFAILLSIGMVLFTLGVYSVA